MSELETLVLSEARKMGLSAKSVPPAARPETEKFLTEFIRSDHFSIAECWNDGKGFYSLEWNNDGKEFSQPFIASVGRPRIDISKFSAELEQQLLKA